MVIKRLLFCHPNKTAGTSFLKILNKNLKLIHFESIDWPSISFEEGKNILENLDILHLPPYGVDLYGGGNAFFKKYFTESEYSNYLSESIRLTTIRNPVDRLQSEWSFYQQEKKLTSLPFVPKFDKNKLLDKGTKSIAECITSDFAKLSPEDSKARLNINDWLEIYFEYFQNKIPFSEKALPHGHPDAVLKDMLNEFKFNSPYFNKNFDDIFQSCYSYFFTANRQLKEIFSTLDKNFILNPRQDYF